MEYVTIKELADQLKTTKAKVNYAIKKNNIKTVAINNKHLIPVAEIDTISAYIKPKATKEEPKENDNNLMLAELTKANNAQIALYMEMLERDKKDIMRLSAELENKNKRIEELERINSDLIQIITNKAKRPLLSIFSKKNDKIVE